MSREWKPGDMAIVRDDRDGAEYRALRQEPHGDGLWTLEGRATAGGGYDHYDSQGRISPVRPLVVIDPEQIPVAKGGLTPTWLRNLARDLRADDRSISTSLENVLTFLADEIERQVEPKPEEPTGLGAVVYADCKCARGRKRFVRDDTGSEFPEDPWKAECGHHVWADLDVRDADDVLSEGVQA